MTLNELEKDHMDCADACRLDEFEREWVHTASKYIDTKSLPTLGKMLRVFEDVSGLIGRWILFAILFGGICMLLWFAGNKIVGHE